MPENTPEVNVRVAVRIRPLLRREDVKGEQSCIRIVASNNQVILGKDKTFTFDSVLSSKTTQEDVYKKCVDQLVNKFFQGYNATVFAYGQTGSGKTYTMGCGNLLAQTEADFGVLPRAIRNMFEHMTANPQRDYLVKVSYTELYKEELRDLLDLDRSSKDLHIREDDKGNTLITGISEVACSTMDEVMECLERGSSVRHTGSTQMNEHSSRSHTVFSLVIEQKWTDAEDGEDMPNTTQSRKLQRKKMDNKIAAEDGEVHHYMCAKFHFVDLAGSERAHRTGNIGDRFKESVYINSGLLALGNVISALGDPKKKVSHIPYRDSKITRILKDSLGGNANTLMICCVSPCVSSFDESLNSMKFANRARNIKNKPVVNRDLQSVRFEEMQCEIKALREELHRQRTSMVPATFDQEIYAAVRNNNQVSDIEDKLSKIETERSHYQMIADEAYKQLLSIRSKDVLSMSMDKNLMDWLELMEEVKNRVPGSTGAEVFQNHTIALLEDKLNQARQDLKSDEEIFSEKAKEIAQLKDRIEELETESEELQKQVSESQDTITQQEEQLLNQQMLIEQLQAQLKEKDKDIEDMESLGDDLDPLGESGPPTTTRRAKSVPVQMLGNRSARSDLGAPAARNIHTSPALFSLERVMAGFRARSQLLASRLDESDDVLQPQFSDTTNEDDQQTPVHAPTGSRKKQNSSPFQRNTSSRGTYRVSKPRFSVREGSQDLASGEPKLPLILHTDDAKWMLRQSQEKISYNREGTRVLNLEGDAGDIVYKQKLLKQSEMGVRQSTQKIRDLAINIRMKEQLIKELIKSGKEAHSMNKQYEDRIKLLEKERQEAKQEISALQKAMYDVETKDKIDKEKLQGEFSKKMETAKQRLQNLVKKQKDTEKMAAITGASEKRVADLERAVEKMRNEQDNLQKKLKEEADKKMKLQREIQKEQQRVRELETKNEQQKKILRVKTEEAAAANRKLRSASISNEDQSKLEEQRKWLDSEMEKVLEQRKQMEDLQQELEKREGLLKKKEAMLAEKSELQMRKLRSSQVLSKDYEALSTMLTSVDRKIQEKAEEAAMSPREQQAKISEELKVLSSGKDGLTRQREELEMKLQDGSVLSTQEERRLIELQEAVEALDAAIDFKNQAIHNKQIQIRKSVLLSQSEDNLLSRLNALSVSETRSLLTKYFEKVIDLKEACKKKENKCSELEMEVEEAEARLQQMEQSLEHITMETDRRLTQQQQDYERKMQILMKQLSEGSGSHDKDPKVTQLEKDLYYYKKTSRELKKKLRELLASYSTATPDIDKDKIREEIVESIGKSPMTQRDSARESSRQSVTDSQGENAGVPVRISRKDLRRMSAEEVTLRMSAVTDAGLADSLDISHH